MGEVFRRYWLPVAQPEQIAEPDSPPIRLRVLGEDLIAFRDTAGQVGVVSAFCPHRRAPMFFGRNEDCGLRCVYHGWKFDVSGACVDMPSEPPDSLFKTKVRIEAYPTYEAGGVIWVYLGPPERRPPYPDYEWLRAPATHRAVSRTLESCNWLQALEGGLDTAHSSFLHNQNIADRTQLRQSDTRPRLEVEKTGYGFRYAGIRSITPDENYVRVYHFFMPAQQCRGHVAGRKHDPNHQSTIRGHFWLPIDDVTTLTWNVMYAHEYDGAFTDDFVVEMERSSGRGPEDYIPGTISLKQNFGNDYLIDRHVQKTKSYTGIKGTNTQDFALQEGMGPICDRSLEHLGTTDRAIIVTRQLLLEATDAVAAGGDPLGINPADYRTARATDRVVPSNIDWRETLREELLARF
jgi:phenylpropionate dioxygenase-like ring-hydroxylating dioxygenase large terminal subunit